MKPKIFQLLVCGLVFTACATTKIQNVWKDDSFAGKEFSRILVVGVFKEPAYRQLFENKMVQLLRGAGVDALSSYTVFPDSDRIREAAAKEQIRSSGIDAVLVARLVDTRRESVYVPGTTYVQDYGAPYRGPYGWYGYYGGSYQVTQTPGYTTEYDISTVETQIFDAASETSIWTVLSETSETSVVEAIESYVKALAEPLRSSGLLASAPAR
jgi:hypothetical protein